MKTYSRDAFLAARRAWAEGGFGADWEPFRDIAAQRGFLWPPNGTDSDDRDAGSPSQRAIVWRAICDTPRWLAETMRHCDSWSMVVGAILAHEEGMREDATYRERDADGEREFRRVYGSMTAAGTIIGNLRAGR